MLSSMFIQDKDLGFGSHYSFVDIIRVNEYIYNYLSKNYKSLDVTNILGSKVLILDYQFKGNNPIKKVYINIYCHLNINNDYVITFSYDNELEERGFSTFEKMFDNFDIESYIDSNLKKLGYDKSFDLFSFL